MFLSEIANAPIPAGAGRYGEVIEACRREGTSPPGLYHLFAHRPEAAQHLGRFMQEVMRGPSPLEPGVRELIAAFTSAENHCLF